MPYNVFRNVEQIHFRGRVFRTHEINFFNGVKQHAGEALELASQRGYSGPTEASEYRIGEKCLHCTHSSDGRRENCAYQGDKKVFLEVERDGNGRKRKPCIMDESAVEVLVTRGALDRYELETAS